MNENDLILGGFIHAEDFNGYRSRFMRQFGEKFCGLSRDSCGLVRVFLKNNTRIGSKLASNISFWHSAYRDALCEHLPQRYGG